MAQKYAHLACFTEAKPTDFLDLLYSPALLLDGRLGVTITDDPDFGAACEWGFNAYLEDLYECLPEGGEVVVVERCYSSQDVKVGVCQNMDGGSHPLIGSVPLASRVGVTLGWLSALALAQYQEAKEGLELLVALVDRELSRNRLAVRR